MQHDLKTWPEPFNAIASGKKSFEFRKDDRYFEVGDMLLLREFDPKAKTYSGRRVFAEVVYLVRGPNFKIPKGYCIMSIRQRGMLV